MTASVGGGTSKTNATSQSSGTTGPWAPSVPYLMQGLQTAGALSGTPDAGQKWAADKVYQDVYANYNNDANNFGQPVADQTRKFLTGDPFGLLQSGLSDYKSQLAPFLDPANLDPSKNPQTANLIQSLQQQIGDQINGQFAGAGRDLSGMNTKALGMGEMQGIAPVLFGQYNQNVANMLGSAGNLYGAGVNTSGQMGGNVLQGAGLAAVQPSIAAAPSQSLFNTVQQGAMQPYQMAAAQSSLLLPYGAAGNTMQQSGTQNSNTSSQNWGVSGGPSSLKSDIRLKRDIAKVGEQNGFNLYRFRYLDHDDEYVGVMAQEIMALDPDAVEIGEDGFMRVSYHRLSVPFLKWSEWNARAI